MQRIGIVGAGVAGLGAAHACSGRAAVTVFEASTTPGGRAASRRRNDCVYDYGANYCKSGIDRIDSLLTDEFAAGLVDVTEPVWTFDEESSIAPGRDDDAHKWTYRNGLATLGRRLAAATDADLLTGVTVASLRREDDRWLVVGADDEYGPFDHVVLTPPAPETAAILESSTWHDPVRERLATVVGQLPFRTILSAVLHYPFAIEPPWYGLVNVDNEHAIGWLSREECKPGHVPDGESLLVVQMSPEWSTDRYGDDPAALTADAADHAATLLADPRLAEPDWTDLGRWRHALPDERVPSTPRERAERVGCWLAGDWVAGEGRVAAALASGLETGDRLVAAGATDGSDSS